jgi:pimeloyl-ACP methyl ester carboxylesterase
VTSLLLAHGAGSGPWVFDGWAESFPGVRVAAVDLHSGLDISRASHADYADSVVVAAAALPAPIVLCGWSMGGLVVLQAALGLSPERVILLEASPPAEVQGCDPDVLVTNGVFDPEAVYGPFPDGMRARPESVRARAERKRGISIPGLPCPSLVVYGDDFPAERGTLLARHLGSETLAFPGLDHWDLVLDPRVRTAIANWLMARGGPARRTRGTPLGRK